MPSFPVIALLSTIAMGAFAQPALTGYGGKQCLTQAEANKVAENCGLLLSDYSDALANKTLTVDFEDINESVISLIDSCPQGSAATYRPLLGPTFANRSDFEAGQGQQPNINFKQLGMWYGCDTVTIRWKTNNTAPIPHPRPVVGIMMAEVVKEPANHAEPWKISKLYSEFDSAAWLQNIEQAGFCKTSNPKDPLVPTGGASTAPAPTATKKA